MRWPTPLPRPRRHEARLVLGRGAAGARGRLTTMDVQRLCQDLPNHDGIRIISARQANRSEEAEYAEYARRWFR
jgi:uncharacterized DUF497 family protein